MVFLCSCSSGFRYWWWVSGTFSYSTYCLGSLSSVFAQSPPPSLVTLFALELNVEAGSLEAQADLQLLTLVFSSIYIVIIEANLWMFFVNMLLFIVNKVMLEKLSHTWLYLTHCYPIPQVDLIFFIICCFPSSKSLFI